MAELALTAVAGGGAAAAGSSTLLTILSGVATFASVIGSIGAANAEAETSEQLGREAILEEGQTRLETEQRAGDLTRQLSKILGDNRVAFAAAGVDATTGTAARQGAEQKRRATQELTIERRDDDLRRAMLRARSSQYFRRAQSQRSAGTIGAIGRIAEFGAGIAARG